MPPPAPTDRAPLDYGGVPPDYRESAPPDYRESAPPDYRATIPPDYYAVEPAPLTGAYANPLAQEEGWPKELRITAGSTSVRAFEEPLRHAAAVARTMLIGAAADRWDIDAAECETADGFVLNGARTFTFGELAEEAADRIAPDNPPLRQTTKGRLIGQPLQPV